MRPRWERVSYWVIQGLCSPIKKNRCFTHPGSLVNSLSRDTLEPINSGFQWQARTNCGNMSIRFFNHKEQTFNLVEIHYRV